MLVADLLRIPAPQVIGHLQCLWWWALDYAQDGDLARYTPAQIARGAKWTKKPEVFIEALCQARFIDGSISAGLSIHDWDEYAGKLIEKRRKDAARKRDGARSGAGNPAELQRTSSGNPVEVAGTNQPTNQTNRTDQTNQHQPDASDGRAALPPLARDFLGTVLLRIGDNKTRRDPSIEAELVAILHANPLEVVEAALRASDEAGDGPWPGSIRKHIRAAKAVAEPPPREPGAGIMSVEEMQRRARERVGMKP